MTENAEYFAFPLAQEMYGKFSNKVNHNWLREEVSNWLEWVEERNIPLTEADEFINYYGENNYLHIMHLSNYYKTMAKEEPKELMRQFDKLVGEEN